jgi:hypothetical protein
MSPRKVGTIIWAALVTGVSLFLGVALYLVFVLAVPMRADARVAPVLVPLAAGFALVTTAASWLWAVRMRPQSSLKVRVGAAVQQFPGPEGFALTRLILACALCEGSALFALIVFMLTHSWLALLPFAVSYAALLAHFPGAGRWARLTEGIEEPGAGRNPMIRG